VDDAHQTFDFVISNADIIGSFGCGAFVLEHNAPIQKHPQSFILQILSQAFSDVSVYYDYSVSNGISGERANEWADKLRMESARIDKYRSTTWIPREFLLSMLSRLTPSEILQGCVMIDRNCGLPPLAKVSDVASLARHSESSVNAFMINRMSIRTALIKNKTLEVAEICLKQPMRATDLANMNAQMADLLHIAKPPTPGLTTEANQ
jgi:hypothetical protein